jgi:2-dehydro-3-deoxyphosphooctonate aldolase (KDO 8-P synthase)
VDIIQIPAFLCRQTDLVVESARTGLAVNIKKGQFLSPYDMKNIVEKVEHEKNTKIILTERGASFGYNNLITDIRSLEIMKRTGYPVIFDATHSVQLPGGLGSSTGGERQFIKPLMQAAVSVGIAGVFVEVHPNPDKALSDGKNSLSLDELPKVLDLVLKIDKLVKK